MGGRSLLPHPAPSLPPPPPLPPPQDQLSRQKRKG